MASRGIPDCECPNFPWGDLIAPAISVTPCPERFGGGPNPRHTRWFCFVGGALGLPPGARADVQSSPSGKGLLLFPRNPLPEPLPSSIPSRSGEPPGGTTPSYLPAASPAEEKACCCPAECFASTQRLSVMHARRDRAQHWNPPPPMPIAGVPAVPAGGLHRLHARRASFPASPSASPALGRASGGLLTEIGLGPWTLGREHD